MSRRFFILVTILILSMGLTYSAAAQSNGEPFDIYPRFIEPPDGSVDILVSEDNSVVIKGVWVACTKGLANAWAQQTTVMFSIDGEPIISSPEESLQYWGEPIAYPGRENNCLNGTDTIWAVFWTYPLGNLEPGRYFVHYEEHLGHTFHSGMDNDGDGYPDPVDWHVAADFNILVSGSSSISGIVVEEGGGPIERVNVEACYYDDHSICWWTEVGSDGSYELNVPPGEYRVGVHTDLGYVQEFFDNTWVWDDATPVVVTETQNATDINFSLEMGGSISGTVTEEGTTGNSLEGEGVGACDYYSETGEPCFYGQVEADGSYTIPNVPVGTYRVFTGWEDNWVFEFYDDQTNWDLAYPVEVYADADTPGIDFALEMGGSISGTVTEEGTTGISLEGEGVGACDYHSETGEPCFYGQVEADGSYTIPNVPVGTYRVFSGWEGNWSMEFYQEQFEWEFAEEIAVAANTDTPNIDFTLVRGGTISGQVIDDLEEPVAGIWVDTCEESVTGEEWGFSSRCKGSHTDENGFYTIPGLYPANYRVVIHGDELYLPQFFNLAYTYDEAELVEVISDQTTEYVNFELIRSGSISGTVYEADGETPIPFVHVDACDWADTFCNGAEADENGNYIITGLLGGDYRVSVWGGQGGWIDEFYYETPFHHEAWAVSVTVGSDTGGIDFTMEAGGSISGTVYDAQTSLPIPFIAVDIVDGGYGTCTDEFGNYTLMGLPFGTYDIVAGRDFCEPHPYSEQVTVGVTIDANSPDVGGYDFDLAIGGSISGTVTAVGGGLIGDNIDVSACFEDDSFCGWTSVQPDGTYIITGLPAGDYRVHAYQYPEGYWIDEVFYETRDWDAYTPVTVTAGVETPGINFTLELGGAITGVVEDGGENPIAGIWVEAYQESIDAWSWAQTDGTGSYRILGLPGGDYQVYINPQDGWTSQDYPGNPVAVTPGSDTDYIDFTLALDGTISGVVTDEGGGHIPERIDVAACRVENTDICWWTMVQGDDTYTIIGLPSGEYVINVYEVPGGNWIGQTYPTTLTLGEDEDVSGIDFMLAPEP